MSGNVDRLSAALAGRYRIERFVVEIKTTAAMSHPHILSRPELHRRRERLRFRRQATRCDTADSRGPPGVWLAQTTDVGEVGRSPSVIDRTALPPYI